MSQALVSFSVSLFLTETHTNMLYSNILKQKINHLRLYQKINPLPALSGQFPSYVLTVQEQIKR